MSNPSSITDKPIFNVESDKLKARRYAESLANFIENSDTPLTIGLQGEWGTGKTSMMYMLRELLEKREVASSWVNTWEYSMFRGVNETTPAVLKGMLEKLKESCEEKGTWTKRDETNQKLQRIGRFIGNLANQVVVKQTGLDVKGAASDQPKDNTEPNATEISFIKGQINEVIEDLISDSNNKYNRVVFFVDDLDRIPPSDAVEVLEALKNMFDIQHCIFVLAIDYEVVVKGLEGKFGKKTTENEREFRSFFDKIIQVPFSMPTGTYDIQELLIDKLSQMGIAIPQEQEQAFSKVIKYTVGYNPRSLKRFLNSFSLLRSIRDGDTNEAKMSSFDDLILFGLLGLQISYNQIFRLITINSDFWNWDHGVAHKFKVNLDQVADEVESFSEEFTHKIDESWERIIYGFCFKKNHHGIVDPYLSARWEQVVDLLNLLGVKVMGKDFNDASDREIEEFEQTWYQNLSFATITNVDDDPATKVESKNKVNRITYDTLGKKVESFKSKVTNPVNLKIWEQLVAYMEEKNDGTYELSYKSSYITAKIPGKRVFFKLLNPVHKGTQVLVYISYQEGIERPETPLLKRVIGKTDFSIKLAKEEDLTEAARLFDWASINS